MTGVWVVWDWNDGAKIYEIYAEEIDALRVINRQGYGKVGFVEWGEVKL